MEDKRNQINILQPILVIVLLIIFGAISSYGLQQLHKQRARKIVDKYTNETLSYLDKNQEGVEKLFKEVFPNSICNNKQNVVSCDESNVTQDQIMSLISDDLTDFSSTAFLKEASSGGILLISLSGEVRKLYHFSGNHAELTDLLNGRVHELEWGTYTNHFSHKSKEVIVPVKDKNGETIGAIARAVIE